MADIIHEYEPPEELQDSDVEVIHDRMLDDLPSNIDITEGGFAWDMTWPSAKEKSYVVEALNTVVQMIFPEWATGYILDMHASRNGLTRKAATAANGTLHVTGTGNVLIPLGFVFSTAATAITPNIEYRATEQVTLEYDDDTETYIADVPITCTQTGTIGNTPMDSINLMASPIEGITAITNETALTDGSDTETDDELRVRVMAAERNRQVSYIGNNSDYIRWAMEVDGVGSAAVIPEWQGPGTSTVKVVVLSQTGEAASAQLQQDVYDYIMGTEDEPQTRLAPIGAILTVTTATPMTMNFTANVELEEGYELATVTAGFRAALMDYFTTAKEEQEVKYTKIASALSQTPGVADYNTLLLNGARNNLTVGVEDLPAITSLTLTEV